MKNKEWDIISNDLSKLKTELESILKNDKNN